LTWATKVTTARRRVVTLDPKNKGYYVIDIDVVRSDTPGCHHRLHFNNAGASLMPTPVAEAVASHLDLELRIGGYEAAERAAPELEAV
jgi:cysteine desulfurase / selenocysteine lyase